MWEILNEEQDEQLQNKREKHRDGKTKVNHIF